jgi:hypothetical protein
MSELKTIVVATVSWVEGKEVTRASMHTLLKRFKTVDDAELDILKYTKKQFFGARHIEEAFEELREDLDVDADQELETGEQLRALVEFGYKLNYHISYETVII